MSRKSWNVELVTAIEGKAKRYKGNLIIPLSMFGIGNKLMDGGGYEKDSQGGLVFKKESIALDLLNVLQRYFKKNKMTLRKEVSSYTLNKIYDFKLFIKVFL